MGDGTGKITRGTWLWFLSSGVEPSYIDKVTKQQGETPNRAEAGNARENT